MLPYPTLKRGAFFVPSLRDESGATLHVWRGAWRAILRILVLLGCWLAFSGGVSAAPVTALAFSPDGAFLLSGGYRSVVVRSVKEGKVRRVLECGVSQIHDLCFSPDGGLLAVAGGMPGRDGAVRLLAWPGGDVRCTLTDRTDQPDLVMGVAFSPDGGRLAAAGADRSVRVYRIEREAGRGGKVTARLEHRLTGHAGAVLAVGFGPDGRVMVSASADRALKVWDVESGKLLRSLSQHTGVVHCVAFRPREGQGGAPVECASGGDDQTVRVWQPESGRMVRIARGHGGAVMAVFYSRDGSRVFSAGSEGVIRVIDSGSDEVLRTWRAEEEWIYSLALSPDGAVLASGDWAGRVKLWEVGSGKLVAGW